MKGFINGYVCRSINSDFILISLGNKPPKIDKDNSWYWHIPGWFHKLSIQTFRRKFGFTIKPGTYESITISVSKKE